MLLDKIESPQDIKNLRASKLSLLAKEIRERIIDVVSRNGGHLASSLGAVELAIALHYCLDSPKDKIIWDVGHQTYAHKILTGRNEKFDTLRQFQGISGFPTPLESEHDTFYTGHSSTAASLALGLATARDMGANIDKLAKIVAVIGDGSISGGLCFEGLNNIGHLKKDILVIINTNEMSISPVVGALSTYLNKLISMPIYNRFRESLEHFIETRIPKGSRLIKLADKFEEGLKGLFVPGVFFEELGFRYFGPLDGNNLDSLIISLKNILELKGPIVLHVFTKKGKGYPPAEKNSVKFHGASSFDVKTGQALSELKEQKTRTYTSIFSDKLVELAREDKRIVAITAAMPEGTGLDKFRDNFKDRFFDVGIAESHAVCFAAGLSKGGLKPVVAIYSTFLQRAYDHMIEEIALQNSDVTFMIDRAGIVGEDGVTHQGIFDIAYLKSIPNLVVMAPRDGDELETMLEFAVKFNGPCAIRYPRGKVSEKQLEHAVRKIELGKSELLKEGDHIAIIALGSMVVPSLEAADILSTKGIRTRIINARFVKPLDDEVIKETLLNFNNVITIEEGVVQGGFGEEILQLRALLSKNKDLKLANVINVGLPNEFIPHGNRDILLNKYGLNAGAIAKTCEDYAENND